MFFKQVGAYAPPLVERVGQLGINKKIGIVSVEVGPFLQTSLKEIFAVGKNPPESSPIEARFEIVRKRTRKL